MPLIFATGAATASGLTYDDVFGLRYEFPTRYKKLVVPGETFVYYTGIRGIEYRRPVYTGVGVVGNVREGQRLGRLVAELHDVEFFNEAVANRNLNGDYFETGTKRGTNWQNGVRRISEDVLLQILDYAGLRIAPTTRGGAGSGGGLASPEHASRLERYSVGVALGLLEDEFGTENVREMPPGNPGFDVLVKTGVDELHVEVKGTILPDPVFHLSEGQRRHATSRGAGFRLVVVYAVDLAAATHKLAIVEGPLDPRIVDLKPEAWTGHIRASSTSTDPPDQTRL